MASECHIVFPLAHGGADALVRSRPPGRLVDGGKRPLSRGKIGTRATRADQGGRPTNYAESAFTKNMRHYDAILPYLRFSSGQVVLEYRCKLLILHKTLRIFRTNWPEVQP